MSSPNKSFHNFKDAYCAYYGCNEGSFVRNLFFRSMLPTRRPLGWVTWIINRELFSLDIDLIEQMGRISSGREATAIMGEVDALKRVERSFWRGVIGLRSNSRRLNNIWKRIEFSIERPELAPEQKSPRISSAAFAPEDSSALAVRRLRQAHTDIVNGQPLEKVLAGLRVGRESFLKQLEEHSSNNPGFVWLRDRLMREERIRQLEEDNANLSRTVSALAVEVQSLRGTPVNRTLA
ncbi:MAG TPA: hypothetical protein VMF06_23860 [Candidatus Limnocylindria bacterium]|jgi:hypothetical protein|nr:hypothetical protein [Candidatus Limnocylindria bacterium]